MTTPGHDPLRPHSHEPNPEPPSADPSFIISLADGRQLTITPDALQKFVPTTLPNCYIVSTGHGTSGPFTFSGTRLLDLVQSYAPPAWTQVEVISADGFGNRITRPELEQPSDRPIILAHELDGRPLTRQQGLVRLIVPTETDDALRQVKWVKQINVK